MKTMNEVFDRYQREYVPTLAATTQRDKHYHFIVLREHFGSRVPGSIKPRDIGRFLDVQTGKIHRNKIVNTLSHVFTLAVGKWYVDGCESNPCSHVVRHDSKPRTRYVTDAEFTAVYERASFAVQQMMLLALLTGQRQGDLLDLTWDRVHEKHIEICQGKTGKLLGIRITPAIEEVLTRSRERPPMMPRHFVIRTRHGSPYSHEGFRAMWQRTMDEALRKGAITQRFTFHDLRAKCASDKVDKVGLTDASALLGHSSTGLTNRVYKRSITMVEPLR
jgi:integrase